MNTNSETGRVAWRVEIFEDSCVVFALTKAKAQWIAVRSYWDAYGRNQGWPPARAAREPRFDLCCLRFESRQRAFTEEHVLDSPTIRGNP